MVVTTLNLKEKYKNYKDVNEKIKRDMDNGLFFSVFKGVYETKCLLVLLLDIVADFNR